MTLQPRRQLMLTRDNTMLCELCMGTNIRQALYASINTEQTYKYISIGSGRYNTWGVCYQRHGKSFF
ncbi:hypothetical protein [Cesiribacter sp. SM1]|uniref:hypothetical protein n=1 Tax=Cesiribacter sp. SM1 TaxID=2861196 RepID=UPI001CD5A4AB|nr:hypothetical protein [Cesiribacter sp. SM1]